MSPMLRDKEAKRDIPDQEDESEELTPAEKYRLLRFLLVCFLLVFLATIGVEDENLIGSIPTHFEIIITLGDIPNIDPRGLPPEFWGESHTIYTSEADLPCLVIKQSITCPDGLPGNLTVFDPESKQTYSGNQSFVIVDSALPFDLQLDTAKMIALVLDKSQQVYLLFRIPGEPLYHSHYLGQQVIPLPTTRA